MIPSETELGSKLGLSRGTVRRAIQILVGTGELTRKPHSRPIVGSFPDAEPREKGTDVHVWVSHPIADEPSLLFLRGISRALKGTPYRMVVREPIRFVGPYVGSDERQFFTDLLNNPSVAGAIVHRDSYADNADVAQRFIDSGRPLVFVDTAPPAGLTSDFVGTTNAASATDCVEHLISRGHRNILCVADSLVPRSTEERINGYCRAMQQAGLEARCLVASDLPSLGNEPRPLGGVFARSLTQSPLYSNWGGRAASAILEMDPRPTALFICYDILAYWVGAFLEGAGVRIPDDMSVVGFDWLARWDKNLNDSLTTAAQNFEGFGRHATNLLLDRIGGDSSTPRHILLEAPLVIRSSTADNLIPPVTYLASGTRATMPKK